MSTTAKVAGFAFFCVLLYGGTKNQPVTKPAQKPVDKDAPNVLVEIRPGQKVTVEPEKRNLEEILTDNLKPVEKQVEKEQPKAEEGSWVDGRWVPAQSVQPAQQVQQEQNFQYYESYERPRFLRRVFGRRR